MRAVRRIAEHFAAELIGEALVDDQVWLVDGDLADSYGATAFADAYPNRFVMAGIAEQNMVSVAAGMARCGARPFVFSFAAFLAYRAADQIRVGVAQAGLPVTLVASHAGGCSGHNGKSHCSIGDVAIMAATPGMSIWTPADGRDVRSALAEIRRSRSPAYCRGPREPLPDLNLPGELLRVDHRDGKLLLIGCGLSTHWALEVQEALESEGIRADVASIARIRPLPTEVLALLVRDRPIVILEDHTRSGGLADIISASTGQLPDLWFGWRDHPPGGEAALVRKWAGLDTTTIVRRIREQLRL